MKDKPIFDRRFVRIKALQNLYAFHIAKQADYQGALEQVRSELAFDIFAEPPIDKQQQATYQEQALALLTSWVENKQPDLHQLHTYAQPVQTAVQRAYAHYEQEVDKDLQKLQNSWAVTLDRLQQACLWLLQLLIEWAQIAQQQTEKCLLNKQPMSDGPWGLVNNQVLKKLQAHTHFKELIKRYKITWKDHPDLVVAWYQDLLRNNPKLQVPFGQWLELTQARELLDYLVVKVLFEEKRIQDFLSEGDLAWSTHKLVVQKWLLLVLSNLSKDQQENASLAIWGLTSEYETASNFYDTLLKNALIHDQVFEEIIQQNIRNWSIERIVLLDKVIIKLALAEMLYMVSIPIKVSMNEYIDLSKLFSTPKSSYFINGVLDAVAKTL